LVPEIQNKFNIAVDSKTIRRTISSQGFNARSPRKVPLINQNNREIRLTMAREFLLKPLTFWKKVIWTDETKINLFCSDGKKWAWRKNDEAYKSNCTVKTIKHGGGCLLLWGCISYNGTGRLILIEETLTGGKYVEILQKNLFDSAREMGLNSDFVFQQDNDPKHTSKIAKDFFQSNGIQVMEWPSQSPDLNIIENIWAEIKRQYSKVNAKSKKEAFQEILKIWKNIDKNYIKRLIESIYSRCNAIIDLKGGASRY
jgi:DDE superfamily endonuclease/Transposase